MKLTQRFNTHTLASNPDVVFQYQLERRPRCRLLPALIAATLMASAAEAQQATGAAKPPAKTDDAQLETIVVTATKRSESLQTVPIAITVISGAQLEQSNLNTLGSITSQTPTVNFRTGASNKDTSLFIRGVGTISTSPGVEPTVSTVIDGVVYSRPGQSTLDLLDIDRVEVLRGPQGTLFGRNASAGVINIISRSPVKDTERYVDISYFQGNEKRLRLGASGEISPNLVNASIAVMHGEYQGNVKNLADGSSVSGYKRDGARARFNFTPNADLKISVIADYMKSNDNGPNGVVINNKATFYGSGRVNTNPLFPFAIAPVLPSSTNREITSNIQTRVEDINSGLSAQVDWNLGAYTLTSITAYRKWENTQFQDGDRLSVPYQQFPQSQDRGDLNFEQTSQELRIASPKGQFFDYVAGLFYIDGKDTERYQREVTRCNATTAAALPSGLKPCSAGSFTVDSGVADYGTRSKSASLFGEGTFNFSSAMRGVAGLRFTNDKLSYYHGRVSTQPAAFPGVQPAVSNAGSVTEKATSGRIGPQFDLNKDMMVYATYSRGYKGPAYNVFFNMTNLQTNPLKPETSDSFEVGLKSTLFDNRLRLNVAAFNTKYDNYQANVPDTVAGTIVTRLINAGAVSTRGIEMDFAAKVSKNFTVSGAAARINARVDNFPCPATLSATAALECNINGQPLPFSPDWKVNFRGNYKIAMADGMGLDLGADYNWQSKVQYELTQSPDAVQSAYGIFNATIALSNPASGWRVALLGKNLANKSYSSLLATGGTYYVRAVPRDDKRYFGINFRYDF